jgi:FtsP/CotA-like multicopper oxidase with cupredoxin domain
MLVNGICTPVLTVEPAVYRFRILNGCNARFLNLRVQNAVTSTTVPPSFTVIGTDQGLVRTPAVGVQELTMVNAERLDVIVDFRGLAGQDFLLRNAPLSKPYASPAPRLQDIMMIQVRGTSNQPTPWPAVPATIANGGEDAGLPAPPAAQAVRSRQIVLNEWNAGLPGWHLTLTPYSTNKDVLPTVDPAVTPWTAATPGATVALNEAVAACFHTSRAEILAAGFVPEEPASGTVEEWEFYNYTADTHPMHVHLTRFQVVDRRPLGTPPGGAGTVPPLPYELGWKDTVAAHPGMVTRIRQRFDLPGGATPGTNEARYVYHCHILEHEDNDMMRPFQVV